MFNTLTAKIVCIAFCAGVFFLIGCTKQEEIKRIEQKLIPQPKENATPTALQTETKQTQEIKKFTTYDFSKFGSKAVFRFSAEISSDWDIEYIPEIEAINVFKKVGGGSSLERSQIFIRYFQASKFLTLSTVDILKREETKVKSHNAVRYEIEKKSNIPNFAHQPLWRNQEHSLIDIRFSNESPTFFYVFAKNPELAEDEFEQFISSLVFHSDTESFVPPFKDASSRITKKPFGIYITQQNSPVQPEQFSGFHTGVDFEILNDRELKEEVTVSAICGGKIVIKQITAGYGGVAVQECLINNDPVTVIYGHMDIKSVKKPIGSYLSPLEEIGWLGEDKSAETDGERKHLHLGIYKGSHIELRGYVSKKEELAQWLNPCELVCK